MQANPDAQHSRKKAMNYLCLGNATVWEVEPDGSGSLLVSQARLNCELQSQ